VDYEHEEDMHRIVRNVLLQYSPEKTLINYGTTIGGLGAVYPIAKGFGFTTTGTVSALALDDPIYISDAVDHICFITDNQWGGKLPNSNELSPTSKAMVMCSNILVAIGGGAIARDELLAGQEQSKPIQYYPAEIKHEWLISRARNSGLPVPESFSGSVHDVFGK
jgi:hypothetical protein